MDLATVQFMDDLHWGVQQALATEMLSHATAPWNREWKKNCAIKFRESEGWWRDNTSGTLIYT